MATSRCTLLALTLAAVTIGWFSGASGQTTVGNEVQPATSTFRPLACDFSRTGLTPQCELELAYNFAPIVYQNVGPDIRRDFITRFDFDGDSDPTNQRINLNNFDLPAHVYYVVIEGKTHRFLGYAFYHPEDYKPVWGHENDMEGIMLTISYPADASASHGRIEVVETLFHNQLYQYYNDPYIGDAEQAPVSETRDGPIPYQDGTSHPLVQVEARGHGVRLLYYEDPTSQVVLYSPSMRTAGEVPVNNGGAVIAAEYALEALAESLLWDGRRDAGLYMDGFANWNGRVYESRESHQLLEAFRGGGNVLRANPPWAWDDGNDPDVERGDWYLAPAYTVASHLAVPGLLGNIVADAEYYITHPFLEYQGNPPFGRQREESVGVARRGQTSEAVEGEEIRISYEGRALREWTGAGDERIAVRQERLGDYIEIPVELVGSGAVVEADVGVPVGRRNAIRLRYRNPYGVPAVRATFVIVGGEEERRVSSTVILAGAGVEGETFDVEVREAMVYNAEEDDIEDLYIDGVELEFTSDLGRWGAEELSAHLPAALWEHVARFRGEQERYGAGASIDVREISIVAGGVGVGP